MSTSPFTIHNIPFGVISTKDNPKPRCATAMEDSAIDLALLWSLMKPAIEDGCDFASIFQNETLNSFAELPSTHRRAVRTYLAALISSNQVPPECMIPLKDVTNHLPMKVGNYTDFYCSLEHATNCSSLVGGDVSENFKHTPMCYNGRASSVVVSGTPIRRPKGVAWSIPGDDDQPAGVYYGPTRSLDYELEVGYFVGGRLLRHGETLGIEDAGEHVFGFVLLNDWSARDFQGFEMKPLGPFHSKGFGTSVSPWIVTLDALLPFGTTPKHDHAANTLNHLRWKESGGFPQTFNMRLTATHIRNGTDNVTSQSNLRDLYWSPFQQITHLAAAGSGMFPGDLMGTGTVSGTELGTEGCLFEATQNGQRAIKLDSDGNKLRYLEDGDEVVLEAWCEDASGSGKSLGLGQCRGRILSAASG